MKLSKKGGYVDINNPAIQENESKIKRKGQ